MAVLISACCETRMNARRPSAFHESEARLSLLSSDDHFLFEHGVRGAAGSNGCSLST